MNVKKLSVYKWKGKVTVALALNNKRMLLHIGRIWKGWLHQDVELNVVNVHEKYLHSCVHNKNGGFTCFLTIVYGLHSVDSRLPLWLVGCLEVW